MKHYSVYLACTHFMDCNTMEQANGIWRFIANIANVQLHIVDNYTERIVRDNFADFV